MSVSYRFTLFAASLAVVLPALAAAAPLSVMLSGDGAVSSADDDVYIEVTLSNESGEPVRLLRWLTPIDGLQDGLFQIQRDGQPVPYRGRHYRRPAPTDKDFITLKPGERLHRRVELSSAYDLQTSGQYRITYDVASVSLYSSAAASRLAAAAELDLQELRSNSVTLNIAAQASNGRERGEPAPSTTLQAGGVSYLNCSNSQQAGAGAGYLWGRQLSVNANAYLSSTSNGPIFSRWFGTGSQTTVKQNFVRIEDAFTNRSVQIDCSCNDSSYAYVYPDRPYRIYVCGAFWGQPTQGDDSKGGTLVHEMSHFYVTGGTEDYTYGKTETLALALRAPSRAIANAESYLFFAEATPNAGGGGGGDNTTVNGSLSGTGASNIHPGSNSAPNSWFQLGSSKTLSATLQGPADADFELYLERWNGSAWTVAARSEGSTSQEAVSYSAAAGYYRYKVKSYQGSGNYSLVYNTGS